MSAPVSTVSSSNLGPMEVQELPRLKAPKKPWCSCWGKKTKHKINLSQHEIDFTIQERKKIAFEEKKN